MIHGFRSKAGVFLASALAVGVLSLGVPQRPALLCLNLLNLGLGESSSQCPLVPPDRVPPAMPLQTASAWMHR